jgi:hypothetical protein
MTRDADDDEGGWSLDASCGSVTAGVRGSWYGVAGIFARLVARVVDRAGPVVCM